MSTITQVDTPDRPADWPEQGRMHFRLEDRLLGMCDLSCDKGYVVRSYDFAHPEVRATAYSNALDDGSFDVTKFLGPRAVSLDLTLKARASQNDTGPPIIIGGEEVTEPRLRDRVRSYLHPARRPKLIFSEHQDSRVRQIVLRGAESAAAFSQPRYNAMSASWVAPRTYIESYQIHNVVAILDRNLPVFPDEHPTLPGQTGLEIQIRNAGNAPAYWAVSIRGEVTHPKFWLRNPAYGDASLKVAYEIHSYTDVITMDSFPKLVAVRGKPIGFRYVDDASQWFRIPPGISTLQIVLDDPLRKGYEGGRWTAGNHQPADTTPPFTGPWDQGVWASGRSGGSDPLPPNPQPPPSPPLDPQGPPFSWTALTDLPEIPLPPPAPPGSTIKVTLKGSIPSPPTNMPSSPRIGDGYIAQDTFHLWYWDGTQWVDNGLLEPGTTTITFAWVDTWL